MFHHTLHKLKKKKTTQKANILNFLWKEFSISASKHPQAQNAVQLLRDIVETNEGTPAPDSMFPLQIIHNYQEAVHNWQHESGHNNTWVFFFLDIMFSEADGSAAALWTFAFHYIVVVSCCRGVSSLLKNLGTTDYVWY